MDTNLYGIVIRYHFYCGQLMSDNPAWYDHGLEFPSATHQIKVAGARIVFETWGEVGRPGIVLIHGSNAHRNWWRFVAPYLACLLYTSDAADE